MNLRLELISDFPDFEAIAKYVCDLHPEKVEMYKNGKSVLGFFVGIIMKESRGCVNPKMVHDAFVKELDSR